MPRWTGPQLRGILRFSPCGGCKPLRLFVFSAQSAASRRRRRPRRRMDDRRHESPTEARQKEQVSAMSEITVRFHFGGDFKLHGNEWQYVGGLEGVSTIDCSDFTMAELKRKLGDHVSCSVQALQSTSMMWKCPCSLEMNRSSAMVVIHDQASVQRLASHAIAEGSIDLYAKIPSAEQLEDPEAMFWPDLWSGQGKKKQAKRQGKLPVFRASTSREPLKEKVVIQECVDDDSDYSDDSPLESDSSAEDEEAIELRKHARELKQRVRKRMLGEEAEKGGINVDEQFIVPESANLDDDGDVTPYFDSDDEISYDEPPWTQQKEMLKKPCCWQQRECSVCKGCKEEEQADRSKHRDASCF